MKDPQVYLSKIDTILEGNPKFHSEAYGFVLSALNQTVDALDKPRHITGVELCEGIRKYAVREFGPMAKTVLEYWGLKETRDFGEIVFDLIEVELLGKQEGDKIEDFENVYDFDGAFAYSFDEGTV